MKKRCCNPQQTDITIRNILNRESEPYDKRIKNMFECLKKDSHLTQIKIAAGTGLSRATLSNLSNVKTPGHDMLTLLKIANYVGFSYPTTVAFLKIYSEDYVKEFELASQKRHF